MLHDAGTRQQSLSNLPDDWRKHTLMQLRGLILRQGPDLEESVDYKMLGYRGQDRFVFHLNAQKGYVSLYVRDIRKIDLNEIDFENAEFKANSVCRTANSRAYEF